MTSMELAWPWSVPRLPFSRAVRPNSDMVTTTTSAMRSPRSSMERGQPPAELPQTVGELAARRPSFAWWSQSPQSTNAHFDPEVRLDDLRHLLQGLRRAPARVVGAVVWGVPVRAAALRNRSHRLERLRPVPRRAASTAAAYIASSHRRAVGGLAAQHAELANAGMASGRHRSPRRSRGRVGAHRDGPEGRGRFTRVRLACGPVRTSRRAWL